MRFPLHHGLFRQPKKRPSGLGCHEARRATDGGGDFGAQPVAAALFASCEPWWNHQIWRYECWHVAVSTIIFSEMEILMGVYDIYIYILICISWYCE